MLKQSKSNTHNLCIDSMPSKASKQLNNIKAHLLNLYNQSSYPEKWFSSYHMMFNMHNLLIFLKSEAYSEDLLQTEKQLACECVTILEKIIEKLIQAQKQFKNTS